MIKAINDGLMHKTLNMKK